VCVWLFLLLFVCFSGFVIGKVVGVVFVCFT
jgi:hypothetical protein